MLCSGIMLLGACNVVWGANPGDMVINELMWMGSTQSSADEWIELRNTTGSAIDLSNWDITKKYSGEEVLMLTIPEGEIIPAGGYFLISNYDAAHSKSKINVTPDLVDTAVSLANSQLQIKLYDGPWETTGSLIDTADDGIGVPAAGDNDNKYSMVRGPAPGNYTPGDGTLAANWHTADRAVGWDAGATERGTPGNDNTLPVVLSSFTAIFTDSTVILKWVTESEENNLGFNIYRSKSKNGPFEKINLRLIKGAGTTASRHGYQYIDDDVDVKGKYYYYIEDIDFAGAKSKSEIIQVKRVKVGKVKPIVIEVTRDLAQTPDKFLLLQNFPNPFNPETWIPYHIPESSDVVLRIYNVLGKLLATIDVGHKSAGRYLDGQSAIHWDGRNQNGDMVPSGVYFYQLRAGKFIATRKMLLVK